MPVHRYVGWQRMRERFRSVKSRFISTAMRIRSE